MATNRSACSCSKFVGPEIELAVNGELGGNYKSLLQQVAQRENGPTPTYQLLDEKGPDHSKCFKIAAQIGQHRFQAAWGRNKKEAEQRAAQRLERNLRRRDPVRLGLSGQQVASSWRRGGSGWDSRPVARSAR